MTTLATRVAALMAAIGRDDIERLSPVDRQHLADQCERIRRMIDRADMPRSGVLAQLNDGERAP